MYNIIIADDEQIIREGLCSLVNSYGLPLNVVRLAGDGKQTVEYVDRLAPEILIIDINMPNLNGIEAIAEIRKKHSDLKIIIISGYDNFSYAQKALELGVFSYLLKPVDIHKFRSVLNDAINSYSERMFEKSILNKSEISSFSSKKVEIKEYLKSHFTDPTLSLNGVAETFYVSPSTMAKLIKERTSQNFSDYINDLRIETAKKLLSETDMTVNEISEAVGYSSQHYFSRIFKKYEGTTPLQYRSNRN